MEIRGISSAQAPGTALNAENPRLKSAAHEFEASLMQEFLKPLQHDSLFSDDKSGDSDDDEGSNGSLMSLGSQAMAKAISERGGFGIATKILDHFRTAHGGASSQSASPSE
jgi:peptidoglycan hydrolase FlgJ